MEETPGFFIRGLLLQKAIWMSAVLGYVPGSHLSPSAFSEAAMVSLEVNRLSGHMCSWNRGPWRPRQHGKLCTQLQNCVWIMGLGTPSW